MRGGCRAHASQTRLTQSRVVLDLPPLVFPDAKRHRKRLLKELFFLIDNGFRPAIRGEFSPAPHHSVQPTSKRWNALIYRSEGSGPDGDRCHDRSRYCGLYDCCPLSRETPTAYECGIWRSSCARRRGRFTETCKSWKNFGYRSTPIEMAGKAFGRLIRIIGTGSPSLLP